MHTPFIPLALALTAPSALAAANDAQSIERAKIPLAQAVTTAEQHAQGKAAHAEFEHTRKYGWIYAVEVVSASKVFDVKVDAEKGTVVSSVEDKLDHDDVHGK